MGLEIMTQSNIADVLKKLTDAEVDSSDDNVLETARSLRLAHIKEQLTSTDALPTSKEDFDIFDRNLRALESTAIASKRIKADEKANENEASMVRMAVMSLQKTLGGDIFKVDDDQLHERTIINESDVAGAATVIEGELDVGVSEQTHESFMRDVGEVLDEKRRKGEFDTQDYM